MSASNIVCRNVTDNSSTESRHSLISWVNELTDLNYQKVEELCSGVAYCRLIYVLFPSCIPVKRIKTEAKLEYEFQSNFKLLQSALETVGCNKAVPISKLIKGKFQENLEFLQWFKKFFDANSEHSAPAVYYLDSPKPTKVSSAVKPKVSSRPVQVVHPIIPQAPVQQKSAAALQKQIAQMIERRDKLLIERAFYFGKLRAIEILCNEKLGNESGSEVSVTDSAEPLISKILEKMYEPADGFATLEQ